MSSSGSALLALLACAAVAQQNYSTPKQRIKYVHDLAKQGGSQNIALLSPYLKDPDIDVRIEAVKAIDSIGTAASLDPLVQALGDNDPEVEIRAASGLVNYYLPGYLETGVTAAVKHAGDAIVSRFARDDNSQMIPAYVDVRGDVIRGLARVATAGASMDARASGARALGVLRGRAALPDLERALHEKNTNVIYEAVIAIQKINDPAAGPSLAFLLRDLTDKVQVAAIDTTGLLRNRAALESLRDVYAHPRNARVKRAALNAIAQMPDPQDGNLFRQCLEDKDPEIRAAAAEGLGRLADPANRAAIHAAFDEEGKSQPRMALAFAETMLGNRDVSDLAPLRYLVDQLNSAAWRGVTRAYLVELAREREVRQALYPLLADATKSEKTGLAEVLAVSGDRESIPYLDSISRDRDSDVAQAGLSALRDLKTRYTQ